MLFIDTLSRWRVLLVRCCPHAGSYMKNRTLLNCAKTREMFFSTSTCCYTRDDHYHVLGLSRSATQKEIKQAFNKLSKQHHTDVADVHSRSKSKYKYSEITNAYNILKSPTRRAEYDRTLGPPPPPPSRAPPHATRNPYKGKKPYQEYSYERHKERSWEWEGDYWKERSTQETSHAEETMKQRTSERQKKGFQAQSTWDKDWDWEAYTEYYNYSGTHGKGANKQTDSDSEWWTEGYKKDEK